MMCTPLISRSITYHATFSCQRRHTWAQEQSPCQTWSRYLPCLCSTFSCPCTQSVPHLQSHAHNLPDADRFLCCLCCMFSCECDQQAPPPRACADFLDLQQPLLMDGPILMHIVFIAWTVIFFAGDGYAHSSAMTLLRCSAQEAWL